MIALSSGIFIGALVVAAAITVGMIALAAIDRLCDRLATMCRALR